VQLGETLRRRLSGGRVLQHDAKILRVTEEEIGSSMSLRLCSSGLGYDVEKADFTKKMKSMTY
jgi:hypothetical protein